MIATRTIAAAALAVTVCSCARTGPDDVAPPLAADTGADAASDAAPCEVGSKRGPTPDPTAWVGLFGGDIWALARKDDGTSLLSVLPAEGAPTLIATMPTPTVVAATSSTLCTIDKTTSVSCYQAGRVATPILRLSADARFADAIPLEGAMAGGHFWIVIESASLGGTRLLDLDTATAKVEDVADADHVGSNATAVCWTRNGDVTLSRGDAPVRVGHFEDAVLAVAALDDACLVVHRDAVAVLTRLQAGAPPVDLLKSDRALHVVTMGSAALASSSGTESMPRSGAVYSLKGDCKRQVAEGSAFTLPIANTDFTKMFSLVEPERVGDDAWVVELCAANGC